jgi:hypothetical protein
MARQISANYTAAGTQFQWADTDDEHPLFPEDLGRLAAAFDQHTHASTRGLAVARVADLSIHAAAYQNASIATAKIQDGAITGPKLGAGAISGANLNGQVVHGVDNIVPGSIGAASLAVLTGNPALRFGPLGHASYGSIRWDGDGGAGTYLFDSLTGGGGGGARFVMQARNGQFHLLNAAGSAYGTLVASGLDIQAGGAGVSLQAPLTLSNNANLFLNAESQLIVRKAPADNGSLYTLAGITLEAGSGVPAIGFHRPGIEGAALLFLNNQFRRKATSGQDYVIWDAFNDGASSGLDADLLDGVDGSGYSQTSHNHNSIYALIEHDSAHDDRFSLLGHTHSSGSFMPLSGGTFTGSVTFDSNSLLITTHGIRMTSGGTASDVSTGLANLSGSGSQVDFIAAGVSQGRVNNTQLYMEANISGASITNRSDRRIKTNIEEAPGLDFAGLKKLKAYRFNFKAKRDRVRGTIPEQPVQVGLMAQDVQAIAPWAIDATNPDELGIHLEALDAALLLYCQQLDGRLDAIEARR